MTQLRAYVVSVRSPAWPLLCGALLLGACGGSDEEEPTADVGDTSPDLGGDADFETTPDAEPDIEPDATPDAELDVPPDLLPELGPDVPAPETVCDDGEDNDEDGATDCEDSDCAAAPNYVVCDADPYEADISLTRLFGNWEARVLGYDDTHTYTIPVCAQGIVRITGDLAGAPVAVSLTSDGDLSLASTPVPTGTLDITLPYTGTAPLSATLTVTQPEGVCTTYDLNVAVDCGIVCGDDEREENDTRATATDFFEAATREGPGEGEGTGGREGGNEQAHYLYETAADDDWYRVTLCPRGAGELWIEDFGSGYIDEGPPDFPVAIESALWDGANTLIQSWSRDGGAWGLNALTSDDETDLWLRVRPLGVAPNAQLCSGFQVATQLDCDCQPSGLALLGKDSGAEGVWIPSGRVNSDAGLESSVFVCAGGTLRGTITSDEDVQIELFADGREGEFRFDDAISFDPAFEEDGGFVSFYISTTAPCASYDLDLEVVGCSCDFEADDISGVEDAPLLAWQSESQGEGPLFYGSSEAILELSGRDVDYYQLDEITCDTFDLYAYTYADGRSQRTTRIFRLLDASGVELASAANRFGSHELNVRAGTLPAFEAPLYLEVTSTARYVCDSPYMNIRFECRETSCDDGLDNDGDGTVDCDDYDCDRACFERLCNDGVDNDGDGTVDCEDEECAEEFHCLPAGPLIYEAFEAASEPVPFDLNGYAITFTPSDTIPFYTWTVAEQDGWIVEPGSSTDTTTLVLGDDAEAITDLGIEFSFFGVTHTEARVGSNGHIAFGSVSTNFYTWVGSLTSGNPALVIHGLDLAPHNGGSVVVDRFDDHVVVSWDGVPAFGDRDNLFRFQAILNADGTFTTNWQAGNSRFALVGLGAGMMESPYGGAPVNFR